jgi:peptidoglycan/LPS O-acetylase OafA/YrhL
MLPGMSETQRESPGERIDEPPGGAGRAGHSLIHVPETVGSRTRHYLPTLDAWRAVAALLVVFCHTFGNLPLWQIPGTSLHLESPKWQARLMGVFNGSLGVDLFFALSGFLITYLSVLEAQSPGGFRLDAFWVRRVFRIVPLAWTCVALYLLASALGWRNAPWPQPGVIAAGFLFYVNYLLAAGHVPGLLGHLWTLGIEMQFYFFWAVVLKITKPRRVPAVALAGIALVILCRSTSKWTGFAWDGLRLESRGDSLFWGAFFGALLAQHSGALILEKWLRPWLFIPLALLLAYVADQHPFGYLTWQPILCALVITVTTVHATRIEIKWMENDLLRFLGRISFSIYIWQQVLTGAASTDPGKAWNALLVPPISLLWIIPAAWLSYRLIEPPGMRLGVSITRRV